MRALVQLYYIVAYYLSFLWFGLGGLLLNVVCAALLLVPRRERFGGRVRGTIRWMFSWWLKWMHASGVVRVRWHGFENVTLKSGSVYVANHPTLVDAPFLLAALPDAICIFKPALLRNPFIAPAAILAGYAAGDKGVDLIREAAEKVAAGRTLLIFPEGTRTTPGTALNPLKPGFALIAQRAQAPIRMISVRASPHLVPRGRPWWKPPALPGSVEFTLDQEIPADTALTPTEITAAVAARLASLAPIVPLYRPACPAP